MSEKKESPIAGLGRSILVIGLCFATLFPLAGHASPAETSIQPGAILRSSVGQCTMNFVFEDSSGGLFVGTAGHCSQKVGDRMRSADGEFGSVVWRESSSSMDFSLVRIDGDKTGQVSPAVRFWGGPVGSTASSETGAGDALLLYGYGVGFATTSATRPREGVLWSDSSSDYVADTGAVNGDSGGPIIHEPTGKALGIVSRFNLTSLVPSTDIGPTVESILAVLSANGFNLTLKTAAFVP